ncbi:MAG: DUF302 domain-containing protein [Thermoplasmatales archaeon]|nr:DUF302 domain-containing protein [Thermoplasmatales archaeon]MCW6170169.1 DUF302 domain-containing protein [Thermoplasmatales archaeon]
MIKKLPEGIFGIKSRLNFEETVEFLLKNLEDNGFRVFTVIDHASAASNVGIKLRPTTVIIFGNPSGGTLLMSRSETIGIDLPSKVLVRETSTGVSVYFSTLEFVTRRHGIIGMDNDPRSFDSKIEGILNQLLQV